ncbi:MAG TPA: energy transducer TonB [Rhizomicrobium sp.]|jgi:protein TonB
MRGEQRNKLIATSMTGLLHIALATMLVLHPMSGGTTNGRFGVDHGQIVIVSLSPIEQKAAPASRSIGDAPSDKNGEKPSLTHRGAPKIGDHDGTQRDLTDSDVARAVTLQPTTAETMTDAAVLLYRDQLTAYLARYRQYPLDARRDHIEGTVYLHFVMAADGRVLSTWVVQSSGSATLDGEALSAIERAQPLPPIPLGWPRQIDVTIPMSFQLS